MSTDMKREYLRTMIENRGDCWDTDLQCNECPIQLHCKVVSADNDSDVIPRRLLDVAIEKYVRAYGKDDVAEILL